MTTVTLENVPKSFEKKFGKRVDFQNIIGVQWDGMDWCQYGEVIASEDDVISAKNYHSNISTQDGKEFLSSLIKK